MNRSNSFPLPFRSLRVISGGHEGSYILGSMFTAAYSDKAQRLIASCEKIGLRYVVHEVPTVHRSLSGKGSEDLSYTKANFIWHLIAAHKKPVLYLDADCELRSQPHLIDELVEARCDFAIHNGIADEITDQFYPIALSLAPGEPPILNRFYRCVRHAGVQSNAQLLATGLVQFYRNSLPARTLLRRWHQAIANFSSWDEDMCLGFVFNNLSRRDWLTWRLKVHWLPKAYARVAWWIYVEPVINHPDMPSGKPSYVSKNAKDPKGRKRHYRTLMKRVDRRLFPQGSIIDTEECMVCEIVDGRVVPVAPTNMRFWR